MRYFILFCLFLSLNKFSFGQIPLSPGSIGFDQTICYNTQPAPLTQVTAPTGGTGTYTYQWQSSSDNTVWTNISGANGTGYSPPVLYSSTWYRRNVTSGSSTVSGNSVLITISSSGYTPVDSLFRAEVPGWHGNDGMVYELGTRFEVLTSGYITRARLYTGSSEGGLHTVRLWMYSGGTYTLIAGPYSWNLSTGINGWRSYSLPTPVSVTPGIYIIGITTGPDNHYAQSLNVSTFTRNHIRYLNGTVSNYEGYSNSNYFRDIVFAIDNCGSTTNLTAGTIGSSQTICYNTQPSPLTQVTAPTGGTGTYTYQWQSSADNSTWTNISGATLSGYTPPVLMSSTYYRRQVSSGSYGPVGSNPVLVTVSPQITLAQLHDNITIPGNTSANINIAISGGISPYTVSYTRNSVSQTALTNYVSGTNISTGILATGVYVYSLTSVTDANGCTAQSLGSNITITVTASSDLTAGTIGSSQTICYNTQPSPLTQVTAPTGGTGTYTYQWQSSADNSTWTNISGATLSGYTPPVLMSSTYYRRQVSSGSYGPVGSNPVLVTVSPQITLAQLHDNITIPGNTSANFNIAINGGISPYTVSYTRNSVSQTALTNYLSGTNISTGILATGVYVYSLTSVTDANGCNAQNLGSSISITATGTTVGDLRVRSNKIVFNATIGRTLNTQQSIFVFSASGNNLNWTMTLDVPWIIPNRQSGITGDIIQISVNTAGLVQGIHNGNISISSPQSGGDPVIVPVTLIINPDVPVIATTWKDNFSGVMSVSVDDGLGTSFQELNARGFQGTFVYNGTTPPSYYASFYDAGMELGSHLTTHPCGIIEDNVLRYQEIEPNISGICAAIPRACNEFITLAWPCGVANLAEQNVAGDYFLAARGVEAQQLEDSNPVNYMALKSYYPGYYPGMPDQRTLVDAAISQRKWFITCLHGDLIDDGAIAYAVSRDIWVTSIGRVIKYILQRDRLIIANYVTGANNIRFNVSRLAVSSSPYRNFELAFTENDVTTLQIDIDNNRIVERILVDGVSNSYQTRNLSGNLVLFTNVRLEPDVYKTVEIIYASESKSDGSANSETDPKQDYYSEIIPGEDLLLQNYPNPFSGETTIEFELKEEAKVRLEIYSATGHKIETVLNESMVCGKYKMIWDSRDYPSGYYYLIMQAGKYRKTIKLVILSK